jgi:hypothetical protein
MAAKKMPAKKMAAPKKFGGNSGSANAAEKRMMDKKKMDKKKSFPRITSTERDGLSPSEFKAGKDARSRATKYGKPIGLTNVSSTPVQRMGGSIVQQDVEANTVVRSSRGNKFLVTETKRQKQMAPDSNRKTSVASAQFPSRKKRDPKFGPAPKKKK